MRTQTHTFRQYALQPQLVVCCQWKNKEEDRVSVNIRKNGPRLVVLVALGHLILLEMWYANEPHLVNYDDHHLSSGRASDTRRWARALFRCLSAGEIRRDAAAAPAKRSVPPPAPSQIHCMTFAWSGRSAA
ncbi:hypothetical protein NL676_012454 [Syzygium grande]|nr:hypothetical protein NL676_012454 [Syzygium grande]